VAFPFRRNSIHRKHSAGVFSSNTRAESRPNPANRQLHKL